MAVPKPMLTEFGIHYILESSLSLLQCESNELEKGNTECKVFDGNGWMSGGNARCSDVSLFLIVLKIKTTLCFAIVKYCLFYKAAFSGVLFANGKLLHNSAEDSREAKETTLKSYHYCLQPR